MQGNSATFNILLTFLCVLALMAILSFTPLAPNWGSYEVKNTATITIEGEAKQQTANQIATFRVGMQAIEADKETATETVTQEMNQLLEQVKALGVEAKDIQTTSVNSYQETESFRSGDRWESELGDWRAENSATITLRQLELANQLTQLLNQSGANSVQGPEFRVDDTASAEAELLNQAVANAREKAEQVAAANGQKVGGIIDLYESISYPADNYVSAREMAVDMAVKSVTLPSLEPGSSELTKNVTVTFELK